MFERCGKDAPKSRLVGRREAPPTDLEGRNPLFCYLAFLFFQKDFCYPPNVNPISFSRLRREDAILFFPRPRGGFAQKQLKTGNFY